jgi:hypothetical protein
MLSAEGKKSKAVLLLSLWRICGEREMGKMMKQILLCFEPQTDRQRPKIFIASLLTPMSGQ